MWIFFIHIVLFSTYTKFIKTADKMGRLDGKVVVLTAAAQGIGRAAAEVSMPTCALFNYHK